MERPPSQYDKPREHESCRYNRGCAVYVALVHNLVGLFIVAFVVYQAFGMRNSKLTKVSG
jgi:hypothetical protein